MTMRDDVRTAFERQQSALGDTSDARHRLLHGALLNRDQSANRGWQWAAAVAAVLIAAIVITTFALVKAGGRTSAVPVATPSPRVQASPTPLAKQLSVPPGTPVILYHDPVNFDQLDGVTWDGQTSGRVGTGAANGGVGSPDGSKFATLTTKDAGVGFWADDSIHRCMVVRTKPSDVTGPGMLQIVAGGEAPKDVARVGTIGASGLDAGGPNVVACSPAADRAVVYQAGGQGIGVVEFWVIQLSTGRTIWSGGNGIWISASHDGRYVALTAQSGTSTVYGDHGQVVGHVEATVFAFSWDGNAAVVAYGGFGGNPAILNWRTAQTMWVPPTDAIYKYWQAFSEPGATHFAIGAIEPSLKNTNGFQPVDLFVVEENGYQVFEMKNVTLFQD